MPMPFTRPERARQTVDFGVFDCGAPQIDDWLRCHANVSNRNGSAALYLSHCAQNGELAGVYTLSSTTVVRSETHAPWMRRNAPILIPTVLLGRLAVARQFRHQGLAKALVRDAVDRTRRLALWGGVRALVVDPLNDALSSFYESLGFEGFVADSHMYFRMPKYPRPEADSSGCCNTSL